MPQAGIDQGDVAGAFPGLDLAGLCEALEADLLARAGDEVVRHRRIGAALAGQRRRFGGAQGRVGVHLQPQASERVVDQRLHDPRRGVELVDDRELVGRARRALVLVADALLLLAVEELVHPAQEVRRATGVGGQPFVDQPDHLDEGGVGRPEAGALVVRVEEYPDVAGDMAEGGGQGVAQQGRFGVVRVLVAAAAGGAEIPEVAGTGLAGDGADHLGRLGRRVGDAGRRQEEESARLHGLEADEPVEQRVGQLAQHVVEPTLGRSLGLDLAGDQRLDAAANRLRLLRESHRVERRMPAVRLHAESLELGGEVLFEGPAHPRCPGPHRLLVAVGQRLGVARHLTTTVKPSRIRAFSSSADRWSFFVACANASSTSGSVAKRHPVRS